jgi:hypothetical protein
VHAVYMCSCQPFCLTVDVYHTLHVEATLNLSGTGASFQSIIWRQLSSRSRRYFGASNMLGHKKTGWDAISHYSVPFLYSFNVIIVTWHRRILLQGIWPRQ